MIRLLLLFMVAAVISCDHPPVDTKYAIFIKNQSARTITFYAGEPGTEHVYPDTALRTEKPPMQVIAPGSQATIYSSNPYDYYFTYLPGGRLSIYIFDADTLNAYPWTLIRSQDKVARRYDLSLDELKSSDYVVRYL